MSVNSNSRIYRIGDYVYVETAPVYPYQIRRIEELTKLGNGQIEAKVQCFYRRRDLSTPLIAQADRYAGAAEEDAEIDMGDKELDDTKMHQLSHRELFLSRQYETINASQIRGKCLVCLYCETEVLPRYFSKEDWFYYCLVYDPQQKALLADKGDIGIGTQYQPIIPAKLEDTSQDTRDLAQLETKIWTIGHKLSDREVDQFLVVSRSVGTFARALDCSSSVKQPSLHMSAAAASRDITQFHALSVLHKSGYEVSKAVACLVPTGGPVLCRDEMEEWSAGEAGLFEEAINKYGKDFSDIQKDFLPWKSITSIIEYYYMWKTTDRYVRQRRLKTVEKESDLKQILVSNPPGTTCITGSGGKESVNSIPYPPPGVLTRPPSAGYSCESCYANTSTHWFPWNTPNNQYRHYVCSVCWVYWKKYGGLKQPDGFSTRKTGEEDRYTCRLCGKVFNRAERLSKHMMTHKPFKCFVKGCEQTFNTKANMTRHLSASHSMRPPSPTRAKPKEPFFMKALPLTKLSRYFCANIIKFPHMARVFNVALKISDIQQVCTQKATSESVEKLLKSKKVKPRKPLEEIVEHLKTSSPKKTLEISITSSSTTHVTKTRSKSTSSSTHHPSPITSPTRKLLHSPRMYVASGNDMGEQRSSQSKHLLSRKRSIESTTIQQNGIDGPATKRFVSSSPLGKKGCECSLCGKVLHNQASLAHHLQTVHATSPLATEANKQKSYPAYCDVNPAVGPGITKMAPYAEHTVTSYTTGLAAKQGIKPPPIQNNRPAMVAKPMVVAPSKPGVVLGGGAPAVVVGNSISRKAYAPTSKTAMNGTSQSKSRGRMSPTRQPQFIDPPEEFVFSATTVIRSSRKKLADTVKHRLPRKPWMEVKCSPELRELIYRPKKSRKTKEKPTPVPSTEDKIADEKTSTPVEPEVTLMETDETAAPKTADVSENSDVSQKSVPVLNSHDATEQPAVHVDKTVVDLGSAAPPEKSTGPEIVSVVDGAPNGPESVEEVGGKVDLVTETTSDVAGTDGGKISGLAETSGGKPVTSGNVAAGVNIVEPIVIDD